jgi:hypothetical protein
VDNDAQAVHIGNTATGEVYSSESKREWELSTGFEMGVGGGGHKVTTSLDNTYGENFSSSVTEISELEITDQTTANLYDQVIYNATNYAVWEYPVYGTHDGSPDEAQTIAVVWPLVVNNSTSLPATTMGNLCAESFYAPSHQIYNVWSYGSGALGASGFDDLGELIADKSTTGGTNIS